MITTMITTTKLRKTTTTKLRKATTTKLRKATDQNVSLVNGVVFISLPVCISTTTGR
jgi:hypothetical protein